MLEILPSVLCNRCSNAQRGVRFRGERICLDCAGDDAELVCQIVHAVMPEMAAKLEAAIANPQTGSE